MEKHDKIYTKDRKHTDFMDSYTLTFSGAVVKRNWRWVCYMVEGCIID